MRALVVFESMFGNTRDVADAVAEGLALHLPVDSVEVGAAPRVLPEDVALLVVGAPTHAFGLSRPGTRADAAGRATGPIVSTGTGVREWLDAVDLGSRRVDAATFDTRVDRPRLPGSAAKAAAKQLRSKGVHLLVPAASFYVVATTGPVVAGELGRAMEWGAGLGAALAAAPGVGSIRRR